MSTEMKTGLVLSGGGAVGAYQAGVVKALAECGTQISMVSGASIGAFNGAIIAASPDLSEAAVRLEALWDHLGNNQVLSVNRLVYFSLLKKLFQAMNLCQIPGRAGALLTTLLRHISILNGFDNLMAQPLLSDEPLTALLDHYLDTDALADGLPLYVSLYPTEGGCMSTEMKTGLVLSGGGAVGAYQAGVVKALAECGAQISMVSGASIGALNGAIIAASPDLSEAAARLEALWEHLGNNQVLSVNRSVYFSLLKKLFQAMNLCQIPGRAGVLLTTLFRHISTINGFENLMTQPLLSDGPLTALMDHYLDTDALADGLPLYVSLYPTEGGMQDIIDCIRAELGAGTTKNAVFQHIQSLPRGQQKEALLASAALPLLFRPREVQGKMYCDGGMGGWRNMQGNTPVTPLVDAGCNMVIVTHLSDGSLWDRQAFPDTTILEIRPRKRLKHAGDGGNSGGLLSFTSAHTDTWRQQGYEDTMLAMEHIRKPLAARQALTRSEAVLQKSLDITEEADLALRNAMARIK